MKESYSKLPTKCCFWHSYTWTIQFHKFKIHHLFHWRPKLCYLSHMQITTTACRQDTAHPPTIQIQSNPNPRSVSSAQVSKMQACLQPHHVCHHESEERRQQNSATTRWGASWCQMIISFNRSMQQRDLVGWSLPIIPVQRPLQTWEHHCAQLHLTMIHHEWELQNLLKLTKGHKGVKNATRIIIQCTCYEW